ncbi:MAG: hypothetical protein QOE93_2415 [Actinomycetota bacterium]|jgi:hypothetical protein|nr:hypothetical protein [Actinomycetota bacterium]
MVAVMVALTAGLAGTVGMARAAAAAPGCDTRWGSPAKDGSTPNPNPASPLVATRTGRHACFDRLVFELGGGLPAGFHVQYSAEVGTEGEGRPLSSVTAGGALLKVVLLEPSYDLDGNATYGHRVEDHVADVRGYSTLRDVVFGGSFEGYSTFAVGVRARLPFRVFVLTGPGSHSRIVVDIAHRW